MYETSSEKIKAVDGNGETVAGELVFIFPSTFTHGSSTSSIHDELNSAGVAEPLNPEMEKAPQLLEFGSQGDVCFRGLRFDFLSSELNPEAEAAYFLV